MSLKQWLKAQLEDLMTVQRCVLSRAAPVGGFVREPDITVIMWAGVHIHIYIVTEELRTRTLKSIIQTDTNLGIGSLFITAPHLLPPANSVLTPPEWLMALHALTGERIYTYTLDHPTPEIGQLHFDQVSQGDQRKTLYGPPVPITQLRYSRVTVKPRYIKGFWMMADFGPGAFWKNGGQSYEPPQHRQYARPSPGQHQQQRQQSPASALPPRARTHLEICYEMLGIEASASRDEAKAAFRRLAFKLHPDVSPLRKEEAEARFKALSEAYEYIKTSRRW